jgi:hypothetical protein
MNKALGSIPRAQHLWTYDLYFILFIYVFIFVIMLGGDTLWHLCKFLQFIKYIVLECTPPPFTICILVYVFLSKPRNRHTATRHFAVG